MMHDIDMLVEELIEGSKKPDIGAMHITPCMAEALGTAYKALAQENVNLRKLILKNIHLFSETERKKWEESRGN